MRIGRCWSRCCGFLSVPTGAAGCRADTREVLNGVLWILRTGAQWRELPSMYPPYQTVHGRFQQWVRSGQLEKALRILTEKLRQEGELNPDEGWIDGSFAVAKKGALQWAKPSGAREPRSWPSPPETAFLWPVTIDSASPHESKLVDETLAGSFLDELPEKLIGDKAYDSDPLDRHLDEEYGIEMIAPNRENRSKTQDGRALRRYLRRWVVERLFAWLHWFRRLVVRYKFHAENFLGMVRLGCMKIVLRYL